MFGYVCGGRPVETNVQQVEPTKFVFTLNDAARINFISIFLLPGAQLPPDLGAAVYAQMPGQDSFQFLGALTAAKQSVIFKLNITGAAAMTHDVDEMVDEDDSAPPADAVMTFGIAIEPLAQVEQNIASKRAEATKQRRTITLPSPSASVPAPADSASIQALASKIVGYAYDYLGGFVDAQGKVPIKSLEDWWNKFKSRMQADPTFIKNLREL